MQPAAHRVKLLLQRHNIQRQLQRKIEKLKIIHRLHFSLAAGSYLHGELEIAARPIVICVERNKKLINIRIVILSGVARSLIARDVVEEPVLSLSKEPAVCP